MLVSKFASTEESRVSVKKTALGIQVMKDRSVSLTPQQRSALILVDGQRNAEDVVRMTTAVGVTAKDLEALLTMGLIEQNAGVPASSSPVAASAALPAVSASANTHAESSAPSSTASAIDFQVALNAAITLCSDLGFKGFSLNMALTGVDTLEKLQKLAPDIRKAAGDKKYALLHPYIFGKPL
jgi:hypothetical protein